MIQYIHTHIPHEWINIVMWSEEKRSRWRRRAGKYVVLKVVENRSSEGARGRHVAEDSKTSRMWIKSISLIDISSVSPRCIPPSVFIFSVLMTSIKRKIRNENGWRNVTKSCVLKTRSSCLACTQERTEVCSFVCESILKTTCVNDADGYIFVLWN